MTDTVKRNAKEGTIVKKQLTELIWPIAQLVLAGMSREQAIAHVAEEHGVDPEPLYQQLL